MTVKETEATEATSTIEVTPEAEVDESDSAEPETADTDRAEPTVAQSGRQLRLSISVRNLVTIALVGVVGVLAWLYLGAQHKYDVQTHRYENNSHAEGVALDYAVNAAEMDYHDLAAWKVKLVAGTSPELKAKLAKAADEMEQILLPLEWTSTARPLVAKVRSENAGIYVVDCFVGVLTKTVQGPEPLQSTATYSVTIDSTNDWQITDVGGIGTVVDQN